MKRSIIWACILLAVILLAGCGSGNAPTATPTPAILKLSATPAPTQTATPAVDPHDIEQRVEDPLFGFAFTTSGAWNVEEIPAAQAGQNNVYRLTQDSYQMDIEVGFQYEIEGTNPLELPLGDLVEGETVQFFGQELEQTAIVEGERVKMAVLPAPTDVFLVDDLFFRIILQDTASLAQDQIELPDDHSGGNEHHPGVFHTHRAHYCCRRSLPWLEHVR